MFHKNSLYPIRKKLLLVVITITFFFCGVIGRISYLQLAEGLALQTKATSQWMRDLPILAPRGVITDKNGVILADTSTLYDVYVRPRMVKDVATVATLLSKVLSYSYDTIYSKIAGKVVSEITIARKISRSKMLEIFESNLDGIYFSENVLRYYPYSNYLTQVLGFTSLDGYGQTGIEQYYNNYLKGVNGSIYTESDLTGIELRGSTTSYTAPICGNNMALTIDYSIQSYAEAVVSDALITHNAIGASCIVMNPKTGAVLAMANAPNFDLNNVPRDNIIELFSNSKNSIVTNIYEPGSTFKILTAAAALDKGIINSNTTYYCNGSRIVDGVKIKCWKTQGHGSQTFEEAVKNSCNCAFMDIALALGTDVFYDYLEAFGISKKTGIDINGESAGMMLPRETVKNVDLARIGFGHAVATTPIGLISAASAAINGGKLLKPYVCDCIYDNSGKIIFSNTKIIKRQVISADVSKLLAGYLENVVSNGSGKMAYVNGYRIGGKTGTAQKYENGKIANGKYIASFIGFAPVDDPEYIVLVVVDEPKVSGYYGSIIAAPYAGQIFKNIFAHFNIEPDSECLDPDYSKIFEMPDLIGMNYGEAAGVLRSLDMEYECVGEGCVSGQIPAPSSKINSYVIPLIKLG